MSLLRLAAAHLDRRRIASLLERAGGRVHVGCDTVRIDGYVNVDVRATTAVDIVHDCKDVSIVPAASLELVYGNAFFEHLYVTQRLPFLRDVHRALRAHGWLLFTGLPDFEGIARAYLERREPGNVSPRFDLYEAYRYTHGAPEGRPTWWLAQLHKGLLDTTTMVGLLRDAGCGAAEVFGYCWGEEPNQVTFGCIATKSHEARRSTKEPDVRRLLEGLPANINWDTLSVQACYP